MKRITNDVLLVAAACYVAWVLGCMLVALVVRAVIASWRETSTDKVTAPEKDGR